MTAASRDPVRFASIRPLVRYVDADQAVIEVAIHLAAPLGAVTRPPRRSALRDVRVWVEVDTEEGFHDEHCVTIAQRGDDAASRLVRVEIVHPQRWWPASMGEQPLYDLTVTLAVNEEFVDQWKGTVGLTSVRRFQPRRPGMLLVNGRECQIGKVVPIDLADERHLLPVSGDSLMLVRGHWAPDLLYESADRAGILLIQCVPIDDDGQPETTMVEQVDRLSRHPSLAGWYVGHLGRYTERMAYCITSLDPTRSVFRDIPGVPRNGNGGRGAKGRAVG